MKTLLQVLFLLHVGYISNSQKIYGKVFDNRGELLPYSSITVKGTSLGVTANSSASFNFNLSKGKYTIICQHIGFQADEKTIECNGDVEVNFHLNEQQLTMKELVINSKSENPAYEVVRQAIKKRNEYNNQVKSFICDLYSKDVLKLRNLPDRVMGKKVPEADKKSMQLDSSGKGIIYLSEAISKLYSELPNKFKMEVNSSRVSGSNSFGFAFPVFINMYDNNVTLLGNGLNDRGFISPIADGALRYYKYKMLGTFFENGKMINSIKIIPKRKFEPLFSGIINITDGDWHIHSFDVTVTKASQLELLDTLQITQLHVPIDDNIWRVKNQFMYFNLKIFKVDIVGHFLAVYSNYSINPAIDKKIFDKVVIKYDKQVNKKTTSFWDTARPVPLEVDEAQDYKKKDSVFQKELSDSLARTNIDSLKKRQGALKPTNFILGGVNRVFYNKKGNINWGISPLLGSVQFNSAEGLVYQLTGYMNKYISAWKSRISVEPYIRYGLSNQHFNPALFIELKTREYSKNNVLNRNSWLLGGGKRVSQYNDLLPVDPLVNSILTLTNGKNSMKTYENTFALIGFTKKFESGLEIVVKSKFENRSPLFNSTSYTFRKSDSIHLTENYPIGKVNISELNKHQAIITYFEARFQPGQQYIQFPENKVSLGSVYPTFSFKYWKGLNQILGSDVNFDKWTVEVFDDKNIKLAGLLKYKLSVGGFLNKKNVYIQDYKHFKSNDVRATLSYMNGFQLMNSYTNSNTASFIIESHVEHHFNGLLTNKIPLIKKLNWNLLIGANAYHMDKLNHYVEYFIGLENIFKIFRLDYVTSYQNGVYQRSSFVLGAGGILGGAFSNGNASKTDAKSTINIF